MDSEYANMAQNAIKTFLMCNKYDKFTFPKVQTGKIYLYFWIFKHFFICALGIGVSSGLNGWKHLF